MSTPQSSSRLDRLESFLREDPANPRLLAEAFDAAMSAAEWHRAEFHLRHALALDAGSLDWQLREGQWLLAQRRWPEAEQHLLSAAGRFESSPEQHATLMHDLAYLDLCRGTYETGIERLRPFAEAAKATAPELERTWLRLLHQAGQTSRAMEWLRARETQGTLAPEVAGVGSLVALDEGRYAESLRWAESALESGSAPAEAMVARASLALSQRDPALAQTLLATALQANPEDGRVWSALGFAHLLAQDCASARAAFERATTFMPRHIGTWHGLGWTAISQQDLPAALQAFDNALELDRNFAESHGGLAVAYALSQDAARSRAALARAQGLDRASFSARYAEALLSGQARDTASITRLAERIFAGQRAPLGGSLAAVVEGRRQHPGPDR